MLKFDRIIIGAITGAGLSVAIAQIAVFLGGEKNVVGTVFAEPVRWFFVSALSGACAGGGLAVLFSKDD